MRAITGLATLAACLALSWPVWAADTPRFEVDAAWPKALPNNWIIGQAAGVAVDGDDHIWVIQRPKTLTADEKAATLNPPTSKCCAPAPPMLESPRMARFLAPGAARARDTTRRRMSMASISIRRVLCGLPATASRTVSF